MIMKPLNRGSPSQNKGVSAVSNMNANICISVHFSFSVVQNIRIQANLYEVVTLGKGPTDRLIQVDRLKCST